MFTTRISNLAALAVKNFETAGRTVEPAAFNAACLHVRAILDEDGSHLFSNTDIIGWTQAVIWQDGFVQ